MKNPCTFGTSLSLLVGLVVALTTGAIAGSPSGDVVIGSNTTWAAGSYQINSLTVNNGATLTVAGDSTLSVTAGVTVTGNSNIVLQGANTAAQVNGSWQGTGVTIHAATVQVDAGSSINADGQGYLPNAGPGGASSGSSAGGSYGGTGGAGGYNTGAAAPVYGSATAPIDLGSGGGSRCCSPAVAGGGAILLTVSGTLTDNGIISANGANTINQTGGASGGSVWITAGTLAGAGSIAANGGAGGEAGGGGGRIAVNYTTNNGFDLTQVRANGGSGANAGAAGTVDTLGSNTILTVSNNLVLPPNSNLNYTSVTINNQGTLTLGSGTTLTANSITVLNAGSFIVGGGSNVTVAGTLLVTGNSNVVLQGLNTAAQVNGSWQGAGGTLNAATVQVDAGSSINADGQGYLANAGPGGAPSPWSAGGSFGGVGGNGYVYGDAAAVYGSPTAPADLGSGGGARCCSLVGGAGGGAILLTVSGTLTNNGIISANGVGVIDQAGGGSGGSVWITTGTLAGAGNIAANGGGGGEASGGGGRVAVYFTINNGFNLAQVTANGGSGGDAGSAGTVNTLGSNTVLTVSDNLVLPANSNLSYASVTINHQGSLTLGSGTTLNANTITVSNAGNFIIGGGSNVIVAGTFLVTGNSTVTMQALNTSNTAGGVGVTLTAANLQVDAGSSLSADGQGYLGSTSTIQAGDGPGGGPLGTSAGGSYGGVGGNGYVTAPPAPAYGSANAPSDLGSGGGLRFSAGVAGAGGGAIRLTALGTLTNNGIISANGAAASSQAGGGSGGSVWIITEALAGAGSISANGGAGGEAGGGGGRIALYYFTNNGFNSSAITANGGQVGNAGSPGTVVFSNTPQYLWVAPTSSALFGVETLAWMAGAADLSTTTVKVMVSGPQILNLGSALNPNSSLNWDTTTVPDGRYELRLIYLDGSGNTLQELPRTVVVNNSVVWHTGTIASSQEWTANSVHGISGTVIIPSGVTVTIDPGTIVKAAPGAQIIVQSGGILNASGNGSLSIIFTAFDDSSVGGDSDFTGGSSVATPGEWNGISIQGSGQFNSNGYTDTRYVEYAVGGTLSTNTTWLGSQLYEVSYTVVVPSGKTLTIQPGTIVKFAANAGINVQSGGQLNANGTVAQPIYFTSINDNSVGGTATGSSGTPVAGDWSSIAIVGANASFDHVHILYGGGPANATGFVGMIETGGATNVTIANSILANSFWVGIQTGYPSGGDTVTVTNTTLYGTEDRAINAFGGSTVHLVNDTFDGDATSVMNHGNAQVDMANSVVTNCKPGKFSSCVYGTVTVVHSDVWANQSGVSNYGGGSDPTGTNGNISADPVYLNASQHDYRLNYGSPAIDAAAGNVANYPLTDMLGDPRYNAPEVAAKTGVADANGHYPDMGAYEFVQSAVSDIDLGVSSVAGPATAIAGSQVKLTWTDTNTGSGTAQGPWHDAIYLVRDPDTNPVAILAGEVLVASGVTLGPGESYTATATIRVPGSTVGNHRWEVKTNDRGEVFVGQNSANAVGVSLDVVGIDLPALVLDSPALNNSFAAAGQSWWYKVTPGANKGVSFHLSLSGSTGGAVQLFIGQGYVPDPQHYDVQQVEWNSYSASAVIPSTSSQTYYVTVYAQALTSAPASFALSASTLQFSLSAVQPGTAVNAGSATLGFVGGGFTSGATYQLVGSGGTAYSASAVFLADSAHAGVTFTMSGLPTGTYTARVTENGNTVSLANALTVTAPSGGTLPGCAVLGSSGSSGCNLGGTIQTSVDAPAEFRAGFPATVTLNYQNVSGTDLPAPLIYLSATGATLAQMPPQCTGCNFNFPLMYQDTFTSGLVLGINREGPAGVLPAGAQGSVTFLATSTGGDVAFTVQNIDESLPDTLIGYGPPAPILGSATASLRTRGKDSSGIPSGYVSTGAYADAAAFCTALQPPSANAAGFSRTCMQLLVAAGYRYGPCGDSGAGACGSLDGSGLNNLLAADATALSQMGIYESDGTKLLHFELAKDGLDLFNRLYHQGAFGLGPSHAFDITAELVGGMPMVHYRDGSSRVFPVPNPSQSNQFLGTPGDYGLLSIATDQSWMLTESTGIAFHFIPDPLPSSTNRHLLDYIQDLNANRVTLTYTNDLVTGASDTFGNTIAFTYDSLGHITQSTDPEGRVTTYTYDIKNDGQRSTFLTSVTNSSGTTRFAWNEGGPSGVGYFDDSCVPTYCEPAIGVNTVTYPDGTHTYYTYDNLGRLATQNSDGPTQILTFSYDSTGTVTVTDAAGNASHLAPGEYGSLAQYIDPLGAIIRFSYDPEQKVTGVNGPMGTDFSIGYDAQSNPVSLRDPLGNQQNLSSTAYNNLQSLTDASGNTTAFAYDSNYNQTKTTYPDGSTKQYTYDSHGNPTSWTNRRGHTTTYSYNQQNLPISKVYANGSEVSYTYDGHRNLLTATDSHGATTFTYDSADRRTGVSYPNGQSIQYVYNSGGQRTSMTDSTGFTVNYSYDSVGRLSQLTNGIAPIVSYTYDAAGRLTGKNMGNGTSTTYAYDAAGNLLHLSHYSGGVVLSEFDYTYDALGNRIAMNAPSGAWAFGYDADSQITSVVLPGSGVQYTYDADGNRVSSSTTSYSVNNLNEYTAAGATPYRYDADGNMISGGGWTYSYDDDNRLIGMTNASDTWTYQYDGLGNRVAATHNGTVTQYLNDPTGLGNVEAEFNGSGQLVSRYVYGLDLTSSIPAGGTAAYYHFDGSGNTAQMTNASGIVVNSYSYLPFGEKLSSNAGIANPFTYVGEFGVMDEGNGLYFMRNRWYSPVLGRFVQQDPIGLAGGVNLYAYTGNGPTNRVDPEGTKPPPIGVDGNTNATIDGAHAAHQVFDEQFPNSGGQTVQQTNETIARNTNGAEEQAVATVMTLVPEAELGYTSVVNWGVNEGVHTGVEHGADWALGIKHERAVEPAPAPDPNPRTGPNPYADQPENFGCAVWQFANFVTFHHLFHNQPQDILVTHTAHSMDPNGKLTSGYGDQGYVPPNTAITYTIYFENQATATAPAEIVTVSDPLPSNLDWSTVQLNQIQFNNVNINVPAGQQSYVGQVNVSTDPNPVSVNATLNPSTGILTWRMQSVSATTGNLPADPLAGFLPPNNSSNQGTGYVTFNVKPKTGLANGTSIANQGSIVFDVNAAIATNTVTNTIDSVYPTSSVNPLPAVTTAGTFTIGWSGSDTGGAGIATYDIFVSVDHGPYTLSISATAATSATYTAADGHTYSFYSMATDNIGYRQQNPGQVQTTTVGAVTLQSIAVTPSNSAIGIGMTQQFTATGIYNDNSTKNLTAQVTWASGTAAATISTGGLTTGSNVGASTISATLGAVTGYTPLAVMTFGPCDITQHRLYSVSDAQGIVNQALGATQAANDVNGDLVVNVVDIQIVMNAVLGAGCIPQ